MNKSKETQDFKIGGAIESRAKGRIKSVAVASAVLLGSVLTSFSPMSRLNSEAFGASEVFVGVSETVGVTRVVDNVWNGLNADQNGVYEINNLDNLKAFRDAVNSGEDTRGKKFKLTADITVSDLTFNEDGTVKNKPDESDYWTPIGTKDNQFKGEFDGNKKTISGLYNESKYVALFGYVGEGSTVENVKVNGVVNGAENGEAAGIACWVQIGGTVYNCVNKNQNVKVIFLDKNIAIKKAVHDETINCYDDVGINYYCDDGRINLL